MSQLNPDLFLGDPHLDEPVDYGPYDRLKWVTCSCCGTEFGDIRDFYEHALGDADE
jgi:hypothetical protein